MDTKTPVAFIIFNRPHYTKAVFAEIRKARPEKLFIIADGPRTPEESRACEETRAIVAHIDWPCEVKRNYAEKNLGLKKRISSGLNWFFEHVESGIILEDDCLPHPSFFRFAGEMLQRYKDDEKIMMVTGDNFVEEYKMPASYGFSRYFAIWGWATWRRAWSKYDVEMSAWKTPEGKAFLKNLYPKDQGYMRDHVTRTFNNIQSGKVNTWDGQWLYACLSHGGFCIVPKINLVSNIGLDGTHSEGHNQNLRTKDIYNEGELTHPQKIEHETEYDSIFYRKSFYPEPFNLKKYLISILVRFETLKKIYRLVVGGRA